MTYNLKDAKEVKEYLENLHTEYQFGCYSEKSPEACHLLADYTESIKQQPGDAAKIYKMNCDKLNYGKSCGKIGAYISAGKSEQKKDPKQGYEYLKKGCELEDPKSCFMAGALLLSAEDTGMDRPTKIKQALQYLTKGCDEYRVEYACAYLAGIYLGSLKDEVDKDFTKAFHYNVQSCDLGNPYGCANLSQMYKRGDGTEKNLTLSETFRKRAEILHAEMTRTQKQLKFQEGI